MREMLFYRSMLTKAWRRNEKIQLFCKPRELISWGVNDQWALPPERETARHFVSPPHKYHTPLMMWACPECRKSKQNRVNVSVPPSLSLKGTQSSGIGAPLLGPHLPVWPYYRSISNTITKKLGSQPVHFGNTSLCGRNDNFPSTLLVLS